MKNCQCIDFYGESISLTLVSVALNFLFILKISIFQNKYATAYEVAFRLVIKVILRVTIDRAFFVHFHHNNICSS